MTTETQAVKIIVKKVKGKRLRDVGHRPQGRGKKLGPFHAGRSSDLGQAAGRLIADASPHSYYWVTHGTRKRLKRRIGKKLSQPFRRKDRAPRRRKAAGKNNVRPNRGSRR